MANPDKPRGFRPVSEGGATPQLRVYTAGTTTDIFRGDVVSIDSGGKVATILTTTGSATVLGVAANFTDASSSATGLDVWVYDNPHQEFVGQDDGDSATPAETFRGATINYIITTGNTTTGLSKQEIDASSTGTAATDAALVLGFILSPDVTLGKNTNIVFKIIRHIKAMGTAGI